MYKTIHSLRDSPHVGRGLADRERPTEGDGAGIAPPPVPQISNTHREPLLHKARPKYLRHITQPQPSNLLQKEVYPSSPSQLKH